MPKFVIHDPSGPDLEFEGELLGDVWHEDAGKIRVFRTRAGKLVAEQRRHVPRARRIERVAVFDEVDELATWLGYSVAAKELLEQLGHPMRKSID